MAKSWLFALGHGRPTEGQIRLVFTRAEAAEMSNADAQQAMRAAERGFPGYTWRMLEIQHNRFIVEGDEKKNATASPAPNE